mmetsp:Transcript_46859/g.85873  ORF Transcript_46859/g.85873 Transcript_46859/m.85873 type:complete len:91 (+) Transcript_46859:652-924(+)
MWARRLEVASAAQKWQAGQLAGTPVAGTPGDTWACRTVAGLADTSAYRLGDSLADAPACRGWVDAGAYRAAEPQLRKLQNRTPAFRRVCG